MSDIQTWQKSLIRDWTVLQDRVIDGGLPVSVARLQVTLNSTQVTTPCQLNALSVTFAEFLATQGLEPRSWTSGILPDVATPTLRTYEPRIIVTIDLAQQEQLQDVLKAITTRPGK